MDTQADEVPAVRAADALALRADDAAPHPDQPPAAPGPPGQPGAAGPASTATAAPAGNASMAVVPARRAFVLVAGTLVAVALLRAPAAVHTGEGMNQGRARDVVLALARPLDRFTRAVGLDWPDERLSALFGHPIPGTGADPAASELATAASLVPPAAGPGTSPGAAATGAGPTAAPPALTAPRVPTVADPLRVLVTGDSLTESLGPTIANTAPATVRAQTDTRYGTGLVRPDFFDWASHAREQVATRDPEVVVVALGANDAQGITMPNGQVLPAGSPGWVDEYRRRALVVLRIWADGGHRRVYWVSLPPARSGRMDGYFQQLNGAVADAVHQVPGTAFLDLGAQLSDHGHYSDYLRDAAGQSVLARTRDGVHYTLDGSRIVAAPVLARLASDFRLTPPPSGNPR
ncbi:SGNH/GDSL hydrolase family protein [Pseudofrankia inefficax]|uniref:SGNH hydrolase-type esterase domain-containing protein n=1 Tax=Pseudofrankia inefficax (strain DSM 45817 / CECT 9037 / DDB 130130 / EuI1c) TaxID=298654 RepID=E3ITI2_PSEI1|nr:DUF459 domain-containing protein [Pseudofrankia inefficax]ADP78739.1 protein of unknown function DUF459 [Pseudofrankia inefficax]